MRRSLCLIMSVILLFAFAGCGKKSDDASQPSGHIYAEMVVKDYGTIKMELYPESAPISVSNFVDLVNKGFYNGMKIHRVQPRFVIQAGKPEYSGQSAPANIKGEFSENGVTNNLSHTRGAVSMARVGGMPDSASSQFFICVADNRRSLDGKYACFGYVTEGMDVVDKICALSPGSGSKGFIEDEASMPVIESLKIIEKAGT